MLSGEAQGSFTLDIEEYIDNEITNRRTYFAIPSDIGTKVTMEFTNTDSLEAAVIIVDYDGNGIADITYNTEGEVAQEPEVATYTTLYAAIDTLQTKAGFKRQLTNTAQVAEQFSLKAQGKQAAVFKKRERATLFILNKQIQLYSLLRIISKQEREVLNKTIEALINKE